jgi:ribose-phosphate pyrophosphokinase
MLLLDNKKIKFGYFPNGERYLNYNTLAFSSHSTVTLKYESDQDLFDLFVLKRYLDEAFGGKPAQFALDILYMPYSRMDRANMFYAFSLKYVCDFINGLNFGRVRVLDAHSDVTLALLNNVVEASMTSHLFGVMHQEFPSEDLVVMYPDAGAQKRYGKLFGYPTVVGHKERDFGTGAITKFSLSGADVQDKMVAIVDDLCSKGGTFIGAAQALRDKGAKRVMLIVTHCEETIFAGDIFYTDLIDRVYTTNSIIAETLESHKSAKDWLLGKLYIEKLYEEAT